MSTILVCCYCAKPVLPNAIGGLCPECLLKAALASGAGGSSGFIPPHVDELKEHFPQFEILELIGQGGMGAVYKARQIGLDRFVALKLIPGEHLAANSGFAERFEREARALASLSHPNIVAVYDFGRTPRFHFLVMELVQGVTLRALLREGKLQPEQALAIVPQICEALQFAHDAGVVHRDIKPENVLIDEGGRVRVADFGLAKILATGRGQLPALTQDGHRMGTPHYMAPEQVEKPNTVDHRADIYSLGVVFYELLTGELPIGRFSPPSKRAQVDFRLDEVVLRALEKEPEKRYQQALQVKTEIGSVGRGQPSAARAADETENKRPFRWSFAAILGIAFLAILFGANTWHRQRTLAHELNQARQQQGKAEIEPQISSNENSDPGTHLQPANAATPIDPKVNWVAQIAAMNSGTWRQALATADAIAALPPEEGWALVRENWTAVTNSEMRKQFLKAFTFAGHPRLAATLELGLLDPAPDVQGWAFNYLKSIAARDMSGDYSAATEYLANRREWSLDDVLRESASAFATRLQAAADGEVEGVLREFQDSSFFRKRRDLVEGSGIEAALEDVIRNRSEDVAANALETAGNINLSPEWLQRVALPRLGVNNSLKTRIAAAQSLHSGAGEWAVAPLVDALSDLQSVDASARTTLTFAIGNALANTRSRSAVFPVIQIMERDNTYATLYGLGYFALNKLTGVPYDEKHDAAWWREWWEKNHERFGN